MKTMTIAFALALAVSTLNSLAQNSGGAGPGGGQGRVTFRIYADNIANKRYWSDTGASLGDTFVWEGAPATVRLSAHYRF